MIRELGLMAGSLTVTPVFVNVQTSTIAAHTLKSFLKVFDEKTSELLANKNQLKADGYFYEQQYD
ncbi:hypothetical protein H8L32_12125 [Undibacterium sp. CY18W]|uniref:Uncharacterized protein n=1 Tax=Undibacterium hunanense TaxID=2762292 RepID=A0ABR6ZQW7_9BURK|nr:hypothetical protein [Undibacterium hunanense]MBC3918228.1 hypothetical protein [Undibacterium hunanense]